MRARENKKVGKKKKRLISWRSCAPGEGVSKDGDESVACEGDA